MKLKEKGMVFMLLFVIVLAACAPSIPDPITVEIDMNEFTYTPNELEFHVGQEVTLILTNSGEKVHELMIGNAVKNEDGLPNQFRFDFFREGGVMPEVSGGGMLMSHADEAGHDEMDMSGEDAMDMEEDMDMGDPTDDDHALMVMVPVGQDTTIVTFTVTEEMLGEWEMACFEENGAHYLAGMTGTVLVLP
jgi:plastocyanin